PHTRAAPRGFGRGGVIGREASASRSRRFSFPRFWRLARIPRLPWLAGAGRRRGRGWRARARHVRATESVCELVLRARAASLGPKGPLGPSWILLEPQHPAARTAVTTVTTATTGPTRAQGRPRRPRPRHRRRLSSSLSKS